MSLQVDFEKATWTQSADGFALQLFVKNRPAALSFLEKMQPERSYTAELKEHRQKRSNDANAYCWVLIEKLANALTAEAQGDVAYSKDEIYLDMLKRYGQTFVVKVPNKALAMFVRQNKYTEQHEKLPPEENAQYYRVWLGSSTYDTKEMSLFLNGIIAECKEHDIDTVTPTEYARMMAQWGEVDG